MKVFLLILCLFFTGILTLKAQVTGWEEQDDYVNGFARVIHQDKFSFVNKQNKLISSFVFEEARNFYHHLAAVKQKNKWGFINEQGQTVIPFSYEIVFNFSENTSVVCKSNIWWLVDTKGHMLKQLDITLCYGFQNGTAVVFKNDRKGLMDIKGNIVFEKPVNKKEKVTIPYLQSVIASVCPDNLDFEFGDFTNWQCFTGRVDSVGNTNVITVTPSPPTPGRHTIYARTTPSAIDAFGLFPTNPPDGSVYAVKLGNTGVGAQAERIRYIIHVPINDSNFSFRYHYAVVLQDPGHTSWTQPRFNAKLFDSSANAYIACASFEYISTSNLPGFLHSTVDPSVIYKPWSPVFISLRGYAGKTLYLDFTTADCVRRAHWGYAYVDVEDLCGQSVQLQYNCDTPHITTLTGPPGFQFYNWWNQNFTTLLGTGQTVTLNPGPPPNSIIWLEMIPFANFGCTDTIPVKMTGTINVNFDVTDTLGICAPHSFTFYNRNIPALTAIWDFGDGNTGTGDTVTHIYNLPGTYIVKLNVTQEAGCSGIAIDTVRVVQPTGSFTYTGGNFCKNTQVQFTATTSYIDSLFWSFGDGTFLNTTQTTVTHTYTQPGIYIPSLVVKANAGCQLTLPGRDTIRIEKLAPGYTTTIQPFCTYTNVSFTDTSYSFFGIATHTWNFGDGTFGTGNSVMHTYTITGTYAIKLVIVGITGCRDSVIKNIYIKVNNRPVTNITGDSSRCVNSTLTFNSSVISADTVNVRNWTCSNGTTGTGTTFNVLFNIPGIYIVQLITGTVNGCYDTVTHVVTIHPLPLVVAENDKELCLGSSVQLNVSGAAQYSWSPPTGLSCTLCSNPIASPTDTTTYVVKGTSSFGCIAYDTIQIKVIKPFPMLNSPDDTICVGKSVILSASGANTYIWVPTAGLNRADIASPIASPILTTTYRVVGYDGHSCFSDTAFIKITVGPIPVVNAGPDLHLATGDIVTLNPVFQNGPIVKWLWEPTTDLSCSNCATPRLTVHNDITYYVTITNVYGCVAKDDITISTFCKDAQVFIPNAFTPDGDGLNDILMVRGKGLRVKFFRVFSRWGELVFEKKDFLPNDPQYGWDGRIRGVKASPDVFVYTAEVVCDNNVLYTLKGNTSLLK